MRCKNQRMIQTPTEQKTIDLLGSFERHAQDPRVLLVPHDCTIPHERIVELVSKNFIAAAIFLRSDEDIKAIQKWATRNEQEDIKRAYKNAKLDKKIALDVILPPGSGDRLKLNIDSPNGRFNNAEEHKYFVDTISPQLKMEAQRNKRFLVDAGISANSKISSIIPRPGMDYQWGFAPTAHNDSNLIISHTTILGEGGLQWICGYTPNGSARSVPPEYEKKTADVPLYATVVFNDNFFHKSNPTIKTHGQLAFLASAKIPCPT